MDLFNHHSSHSSGDLIADRRFRLAEGYAGDGDHQAARDLLEQIVEHMPHWPAAWFALGRAREALGCREGAIAAFARAAVVDDDALGSTLHLARLGAAAPPAAAPAAYVKGLFDQYAGTFEAHLVDKLAYRAPQQLRDALADCGRRQFARLIDLGCGTGLCGEAFRARAEFLTGVDLSPRMIARAREKHIYDRLLAQDIGVFLAQESAASADLLLAADVLCYVGDLGPLFQAARRVVQKNGYFAFTVQKGDKDIQVGDDMRYAHAEAYVRTAAQRQRFAIARMIAASIRRDAGRDVPGFLVVLEAV